MLSSKMMLIQSENCSDRVYKKSFSFYLQHQVSGFRCNFKPFRISMFDNNLQSTMVGEKRAKLTCMSQQKAKLHHNIQLTSNDL